MLRRPTSAKPFFIVAAVFFAAFAVAGFATGAAGFTQVQAMLVAGAIAIVVVPVLVAIAPKSFLDKLRP